LAPWRNAIIAGFSLGGMSGGALGARMPAIRAELGVSTGLIGVIVACSTVGSVIRLMFARRLLHRLGGRGAVQVAFLVAAGALVVIALGLMVGSAPLVCIGFTMIGAGLGALDVALNVQGAAVEQAADRTLLPLMHAGWPGGAAIGAAVSGACAGFGVKPGLEFLALAALAGAVGLELAHSIPAGVRRQVDAGERPSRRLRLRRWARGWADRRLLLIGLVLLGVEFAEGSANNWLSLAARQNHGQPAAVAALLLTLFAVSEASARVAAGPLVDRLGRVRVLRYTAALGVCGVAVFVLSQAVWLIAIGVVLWAIGVSLGIPLGMSAAAEGEDPPTRVSVAASIGYQASLIGPPAVGLLAEAVGLLKSLWLLAILLLAALAAAGSLRPSAAHSNV
jgi:MFS family permease